MAITPKLSEGRTANGHTSRRHAEQLAVALGRLPEGAHERLLTGEANSADVVRTRLLLAQQTMHAAQLTTRNDDARFGPSSEEEADRAVQPAQRVDHPAGEQLDGGGSHLALARHDEVHAPFSGSRGGSK